MNKFVLAFPISANAAESFKITETMDIKPDANKVMIPGCSVMFDVVRNEASVGLSDIFREHREISADEAKTIDAHKSLLFLIGNAKSADDLRMVNVAILKMLSAGASGVYMQQSGSAWTADAFREELGDGEFPMDPWLNFVEGSDTLYTLGMECFGLPDLCMGKSLGSVDELEDILSVVADSLFVDGVSSKSGTEVDGGEFGKFTLRAESKTPFAKDSPEFNKQGVMRLVKKS